MLPPLVARGRAHASRFPRPYWWLVAASALKHSAWGMIVPFWALYLTGTLHATGAEAGALLALAGGVGLVGAPLGGILADRLGRRRTLIGAAIVGGTLTCAYGLSTNLLAIALITPVMGIAGDVEGPAVSAAIADLVEPELRTEAYGLRRQATNLTFALGPPLGALVTLGFSLRWIFVAAGLVNLAVTMIYVRAVPETLPERKEGEAHPRLRDALRDRLLLLLALGTGIGIMVYVQFDSVLGVFLHANRGYALATWGLVFGLNPIIVGLAQYPVARWAGKRSPRAMLALGTVLQGLALFALWPASPIVLLVVSILVLTAGEMILSPVASALAAALAPSHLRGSYEGVVDVAFAVFWSPGVLIGLWLIGRGHGEVMLVLALPLALAAALCFLPLPRRPQGGVEDVLPVPVEASVV